MNVRSVTQAPVRTLISRADSIDDPSATLPTGADVDAAADSVDVVRQRPQTNDLVPAAKSILTCGRGKQKLWTPGIDLAVEASSKPSREPVRR